MTIWTASFNLPPGHSKSSASSATTCSRKNQISQCSKDIDLSNTPMPTITQNKTFWSTYTWEQDGDERHEMSTFDGVPYAKWKQSIIDAFIKPNTRNANLVLEIGVGHGRWTEFLADAPKIIGVDTCESCIAYCKEKLGNQRQFSFILSDGTRLNEIETNSVDFIWSFDCFVYMEAQDLASYLKEINRVLCPGGQAIIHHAGRRPSAQRFSALKYLGPWGRKLYQFLSLGKLRGSDGMRGEVTAELVKSLAAENNLEVLAQVSRWGKFKQYSVDCYRDKITILQKK